MEALECLGADTWMLPCPRALDHTPPGDWTVTFARDPTGRVTGAHVGCWLARRLWYAKLPTPSEKTPASAAEAGALSARVAG